MVLRVAVLVLRPVSCRGLEGCCRGLEASVLVVVLRVAVLLTSLHRSRGCYDNPLHVLRSVFGAMRNTMCAKRLYAWWCKATVITIVCVCVCESFVLYIYSAQPRLQVSLDGRPLYPMPDRHRVTQAHLPSPQGHSGPVLW